MKTATQIIAIITMTASFGTVSTFADDQSLQKRLAIQRQAEAKKETTIAFSGHRKSQGNLTMKAESAPTKAEMRFTPHGTLNFHHVPAK